MWKNSLKNVESDNNKILYETLLDFFYSDRIHTDMVDDQEGAGSIASEMLSVICDLH